MLVSRCNWVDKANNGYTKINYNLFSKSDGTMEGFLFWCCLLSETFIKSHHLLQYILHLDSERRLYFAYIINLIDIIYITVLCLLMLFLWSK